MKQITGREFCRVLLNHGWNHARTKGSHHIFIKDGQNYRISVPLHGNKPLKIGLLKSLMRIASIEESDL